MLFDQFLIITLKEGWDCSYISKKLFNLFSPLYGIIFGVDVRPPFSCYFRCCVCSFDLYFTHLCVFVCLCVVFHVLIFCVYCSMCIVYSMCVCANGCCVYVYIG